MTASTFWEAGPTWEELSGASLADALWSAVTIGVIEETAKLLPVLLIGAFSSHFDEPLDGLVYAGAPGLAFRWRRRCTWPPLATTGLSLVARLVAAPLSQAMLALPAGYGMARLVMGRKGLRFSAGFAVSVLAHAAYDLTLARPDLPTGLGAGVILLLWIWFLWLVPRLRTASPLTAG